MTWKNIRPGRAARRPAFEAKALVLVCLAAAASCDTATPTESTVALPIGAFNKVGEIPGSGRPFDLDMTREVTATNPGDPDGAGVARMTINAGQRTLCYSLSVWNIALPATASHVHRAPPGVAGPVVIGLTAPGGNGSSTGCVTGIDRDLLKEILTSPESFYVNVHTTEHPPGAIRSQMR